MGDIKEETQSKVKESTKMLARVDMARFPPMDETRCKICSSEAVPELYGYCEYCYKNVA